MSQSASREARYAEAIREARGKLDLLEAEYVAAINRLRRVEEAAAHLVAHLEVAVTGGFDESEDLFAARARVKELLREEPN